jgi:hypothetical protein
MAGSAKIVELKQRLVELFPATPRPHSGSLSTAVENLDALGGLPAGAISEIACSPPHAGSALLIHALLRADRINPITALVDARDSFDPTSLPPGTPLLWVRCARALHAVKATDILLRDGNVPLVLLDLWAVPLPELKSIQSTVWYRFQRVLEGSSNVLLVITRRSCVPSAQLKLNLTFRPNIDDLGINQTDLLPRLGLEISRQRRPVTITGEPCAIAV